LSVAEAAPLQNKVKKAYGAQRHPESASHSGCYFRRLRLQLGREVAQEWGFVAELHAMNLLAFFQTSRMISTTQSMWLWV